jgi:hypothetical protein
MLAASTVAAPRPDTLRKRIVNRNSATSAAAVSAFGQIRNSPHEWGRGVAGFGKRFASAIGQHAVKVTIQAGVGALHPENLHYQPSGKNGTLPRIKYAVVHTFWVPKKNRPGNTVALSRVSGSMGAGMISRLWMPASAAGIGAGIASGGISLGAETGVNVAREFWPRHHRKEARSASAPVRSGRQYNN